MSQEPERGDNKAGDKWGRWKMRWKVFIGKKHRKQWLIGGMTIAIAAGLVLGSVFGIPAIKRYHSFDELLQDPFIEADIPAFIANHECALPEEGYEYKGPPWRILRTDEEPQRNDRYPYDGQDNATNWEFAIKRSSVAVEVEFLHFRDAVSGGDVRDYLPPEILKTKTPEEIEAYNEQNRSFTLLSECRVVRVLAKRENEADVEQLQKGDIITLAVKASSRHRYLAAPQISVGDRAVFLLFPTHHLGNSHKIAVLYRNFCDYMSADCSSFYIPMVKKIDGSIVPDYTSLDQTLKRKGLWDRCAGMNITQFALWIDGWFRRTPLSLLYTEEE